MQARVYGNPPYGHAELSTLGQFCAFLSLDPETVVQELKMKKLQGPLNKEMIVLKIAKNNNLTPQELYSMMRQSVSPGNPYATLPPTPPPGTGAMTLRDLCNTYQLPLEDTIQGLKNNGVQAAADETLREIAQKHDQDPHAIYELLGMPPKKAALKGDP